jgi:hypothetical protein
MDIGSLFLALALILLVVAFVARPIIDGRLHPESDSASPLDSLITQREAVLTELRELDFDHSTGKVGDEDYAAQRARLLAHGAEVLKALDQAPSVGHNGHSEPVDDEIERLVAARRKGSAKAKAAPAVAAPGSHFCTQCGKPIQPNDKFCASCGAKVSLPEAVR